MRVGGSRNMTEEERKEKPGRLARLRLRRYDGAIYLDRWGIEHDRIGGIFLHRMSAPDPGDHLHDHPWAFWSVLLRGGYVEERAEARDASLLARIAEEYPDTCTPGVVERRSWLSGRLLRLDECHRITALTRRAVWTLVIHGPRRRSWGFFTQDRWVHYRTYDETHRAEHRDLWSEAV